MLNQEAQVEVTTKHPNNSGHNPLNDHDYCSPNKKIAQQQKRHQQQSDRSAKDQPSNQTTPSNLLPASDSVDSDPLSTAADFEGAAERRKISRTLSNQNDDGDLSDSSSSSSSLSSSVASSKELIIAQDSYRPKGKLVAPKDTPSVSKRKLGGGRYSAGGDMDDGTLQASGQVRAKRARQSTSVTDKSEWIMGDDQIDSILSEHLKEEPKEKRSRATRELDPAFSHYPSSDYSSSDAESDRDSDNSDDDPDKLWCICRKPHGGKFMIACDGCRDWFHGHCVGVTKLMGDRFENEGKEWFCGECQEKIRAGIPKTAIEKRVTKKEKKKKNIPIPGKRGRGRPRKSETLAREGATRVSQRNTRKSSSSLDPKLGVDNGRLRKNLARSDVKSFDETEETRRLKKLIKERKKEFFYKRSLQDQQKAAKRNELGLGRQSLTANLSDSLDSLATSTSTPNMSNLPINIKSEHKERPKPNIVLQINTKKDPGSDQNNPSSRIVTTIVRSPKKSKHSESINPIANDLFTAEPIQINKKVKSREVNTPSASVIITGCSGSDASTTNGDAGVRRRSNSGGSAAKNDKSPIIPDKAEQSTPKKKRKDSDSSAPNGSSSLCSSKHIVQKIKDCLEMRSKQIKDLELSPDKIEKLATEIEGQMNECFKEGTQKYKAKFMSLLFNLRDPKNQGLVRNVLVGEIQPAKLVRMSADEMASQELAKWRERENKHSIELIKRDAQLAAQQVIVKKTHKGEEVISAPLLNEPDDPTAEVDHQEPPTTPTKPAPKELRADDPKMTSPQASVSVKSGPLIVKITGIASDTALKASSSDHDQQVSSTTATIDESLPFMDTTKDHKNHIFDINCRICTKRETEPSNIDSTIKPATPKSEPEQQPLQPDQPKRFRVSIDTKLDPANISRLREPLIKPSQPSELERSYSPSRTPPCESSNYNEGVGHDDEEDDVYDPEIPPQQHKETGLESRPIGSNESCWSGTITMPDVPKFSASARAVSGSVDFMKDEISQNLMICGRIAPDQVQGYIKKIKSTTKNQILIIQLLPLTPDDKSNFNAFFDYLYSRNRYGVIQTSPNILKDFYILPIHEKSSLPDILKPIKGPGIDRREPNCLLGLLIRSKRPSPSASNYTPTPIK